MIRLLPSNVQRRHVIFREAPVRFGSVAVWGWNGSSGSGFRFRRFHCKKGFSVFQYSLAGRDGSGSGFGSWKTVPAVPVPLSVSGKTVPTVPVSGSGSVPEPPCIFLVFQQASNRSEHDLGTVFNNNFIDKQASSCAANCAAALLRMPGVCQIPQIVSGPRVAPGLEPPQGAIQENGSSYRRLKYIQYRSGFVKFLPS